MHFLNLFPLFVFVFLFSLLVTGDVGVLASPHHHHRHENERDLHQSQKGYSKLFVFGDSYADTGNNRKTLASSWKEPYGITFPGKPTGRYSDGRVFTDFIAKHLGLKTPTAYRWLKYAGQRLRYGMNFAYGGTGVFPTLVLDPNMTVQINFFNNLLNSAHIFSKVDLQSALVLVTLSGNDYSAYLTKGGTFEGLPGYITLVVNQLAVNLKRIYDLGAKKIAITALQPLGCLPRTTIATSFLKCNDTENTAVAFHNSLLQQAVAKLNNETKSSTFVIIDLYTTFTTIFERKDAHPGSLKFESPLKGCCMGISQAYSCGSVNEKGEKMYTVCDAPQSSFFWDSVHPTQAGWRAVYNHLQPTLDDIIY